MPIASLSPMTSTDWATQLAALSAAWQGVVAPKPLPVEAWSAEVTRLKAEMDRLRVIGQWDRGPHDLLSIVGLGSWELAHCAALGWLCDPDGSHGLGAAVPAYLLGLCGGAPEPGPVRVALEETRDDTRADVIVRGTDWTLVIEVKVDAIEGPRQAERLHHYWQDEPGVHFIFLTRSGRPPRTAADSLPAWTPLSWADLTRTLVSLCDDIPTAALGRPAAVQYLKTLQHLFLRSRS
jgi:hypothetical protein